MTKPKYRYSFELLSQEDGSHFVYDIEADSLDEAHEKLEEAYPYCRVLSTDRFDN